MNALPAWLLPQPVDTTSTPPNPHRTIPIEPLDQDPSYVVPRSPPEVTRALIDVEYAALFVRAMECITGGGTLANFLRREAPHVDPLMFQAWMRKVPARKQMLKEAKEHRAEVLIDQSLNIADGKNLDGTDQVIPEETPRAKLRIDTRVRIAGFDNRKVYGDVKTIDIGGSISITGVMQQALARAQTVIDAEVVDSACQIEGPKDDAGYGD